MSKNLHRRHLDAGQRGMIAARIANMPSGRRTDLEPSSNLDEVSRQRAGELLNVGKGTVSAAKTVLRAGTPEEIEAVEKGEAAVSTTAKQTRKGQDWVKILPIFPT